MAKHSYDCAGMATKYGVLCGDGRTIMPGAFKDQDGTEVPVVWMHQHNSIDNVLGHALLKSCLRVCERMSHSTTRRKARWLKPL